ncbi:MAG: phenylacetate--CoA ligase family protein [Candidatus Kariarchaeaceae archaeon]|jgi:phenylacetate-coenzyme A ligase PaaK-like adenylate-forming protein
MDCEILGDVGLLKTLLQNQNQKLDKLKHIVLTANEQSQLYKEKYADFDFSLDFERKFPLLPLLEREDYYKGMKPPFPLLSAGISNSYIFTSGGTSGDVKLTAWGPKFVENWIDECYRSLKSVGLRENDVVINLFFPGIWATHTLINKALEKANVRIIPLGGKLSLELLVEYIIRFKVTVLIGVPSFIVRLTEHIESLGAFDKDRINIKKVFHAGEFLSSNQATYIKDKLDCKISPFIYSSTDTGTIGMKCPHSATNQYHIADSMYLEVLDSDTGDLVPDGEPGEFVVTSLVNEKAPGIRYRVGDKGTINEETCPCGNQAPLFTLLGRADDEVKVAGYLVSPTIIEKGLEKIPEISRNIQLIVEEEGQKTKLTIALETKPSITGIPEDLSAKISSSVIDGYDILGVLIKQGYCLPLEIQILQPGTIPRNPRTGKIKRVRNLR